MSQRETVGQEALEKAQEIVEQEEGVTNRLRGWVAARRPAWASRSKSLPSGRAL